MTRFKTAAIALAASAGLTLGAFAMASPAAADDYADYSCSGGWSGTINDAFYVGGNNSDYFSFTADVSGAIPGDWTNPPLTAVAVWSGGPENMSGIVISGTAQFDGTTSDSSESEEFAPDTVIIDNPSDPEDPITCEKDD